MSKQLRCKPLKGSIADQPPLVQAMIRGGVAKGLAAGPVGVSLQREERDMGEMTAVERDSGEWTRAEVLRLAEEEGLDTPAIADRLGRSVRSVGQILSVERRRRQRLEGHAAPTRPKVEKPKAAVVELAPATEAPPAAVRGDAKMLLAHAMRYAVASGLSNYCLMLNAPLPAEAQAVFDVVLPDTEVSDVVEGGRVLGWEVTLPAGCGLRSVRVMVE